MQDAELDLLDALAEGWDDEEVKEPPDEERVERMLWARRRLLDEVQRLVQHCDRQRMTIDQWEERMTAGPLADIKRIEGLVEGFARAALAGAKKRSRDFVPARLQLRKPPSSGSLQVIDGDAVVRHVALAERPSWLKRRVTIDREALKEGTAAAALLPPLAGQPEGVERYSLRDKETGELVPGVVLMVETKERFSIIDSDAPDAEPEAEDGEE